MEISYRANKGQNDQLHDVNAGMQDMPYACLYINIHTYISSLCDDLDSLYTQRASRQAIVLEKVSFEQAAPVGGLVADAGHVAGDVLTSEHLPQLLHPALVQVQGAAAGEAQVHLSMMVQVRRACRMHT